MNVKIIVIYIITINILGFFAMGIDKYKAKKGSWRISESTLFMLCILGGGIGTIAGMKIFHHKTKKKAFSIGMPLILIMEILIFTYFKFIL